MMPSRFASDANKNNKPAKVKAPAPGNADGDSEPQKLKSAEQNQEVKKIKKRAKKNALKVFTRCLSGSAEPSPDH